MGWSNKRRLLVGGAAIASLLVFQGLRSPASPLSAQQPAKVAKRLPPKTDPEPVQTRPVVTVAYQETENEEFFPTVEDYPAVENKLRANVEVKSIREEVPVEGDSEFSELPTLPPSNDLWTKSDSATKGPWTRNELANDDSLVEEGVIKVLQNDIVNTETPDIPLVDFEASQKQSVVKMLPVSITVSAGVAQKAGNHIEYGKALARRGASFAARQEFYYALQLVAQAMDAKIEGNYHSKSLNEALSALKEAEEFQATDSESQIGMRADLIAENHLSKVVTVEQAAKMTPIELMQEYYRFAENRMVAGSGPNPIASEAYYCLGKLHSLLSKSDGQADRLDVAKAIVYHRASLSCDQSNYRSANELGALLARNGQLEAAKRLLKQSLLVRKTPEAWKNLAIVHERLGENRFSQLALGEFQISTMQPMATNATSIQWLGPKQFNDAAPIEYHDNSTARAPTEASPLPHRRAALPQTDSGNFLNKLNPKNWR